MLSFIFFLVPNQRILLEKDDHTSLLFGIIPVDIPFFFFTEEFYFCKNNFVFENSLKI